MKLTINGRILEDVQVAGRYPDKYVESASYVDDGSEVSDTDLESIDSSDLDMWISENY